MESNAQQGHLMIGLVLTVAIMLVLSTVATQAWVDLVRRDDEAEMIFRAQEIVQALALYQQDKGALPTDLEQLLEPGSKGQYFIRRLYDDPLVPDGNWGLLYAAPGGGLYDPSAGGQEAPGATLGLSNEALTSRGGMQSSIGSGSREVAGLPIAGVKTRSTDTPFRHYKDMADYSLWLFSIFDNKRGPAGGQPGSQISPGQQTQQGPGPRQPGSGLPGRGQGGSRLRNN